MTKARTETETKYICMLDVIGEQIDEIHADAPMSEANDDLIAEMLALRMMVRELREQYK